ncbi:MAG: R3H domain-containing nucleic acid-binding protein [Acidimicrobiia bacterium]
MTEWREIQASDRDAALDEAVRLLGVAVDDMEIGELPSDEGIRLVVRVAGDTGSEESGQPESEAAEVADHADEEGSVGSRQRSRDEEVDPALLRQQQDVALDFLEELLEAFDLEGEIAAEYRDTVLHLDVGGDDLGSLIGRRGTTLAALAEVTKTVVQRRTAARVRVNVDVQGYRARRRSALERFAGERAREVLDRGIEVALDPMTAADRKVVHDVVAKIDGVRSYSEGQEPKRNVVLSPA